MKRERKMLDDDDEEDDYDGYGHRGKRMKTENGRFLHHDQSERHHHPVSFSFFGSSDQNEDTKMHEAEESETTHINISDQESIQESIQEPPNEVPIKFNILPKQEHEVQNFEKIFKNFQEVDKFIATAILTYRRCLEVHDAIIKGRINVLEGPLQIEKYFGPLYIWCIKLIFEDHSHLVLDIMSKNPTKILPVVMRILKKKHQECLNYRSDNINGCVKIYAAILCKLLGDIIQKSEQEFIVQEPEDEEGEGFQDHNENDFSGDISCMNGKELLIFPNTKRRNHQNHEEQIIKIMLELDDVIEILLKAYERCFQLYDNITEGRINVQDDPFQIEEHFNNIHLWCFEQIERQYDVQVLESVRKNPIRALPDIMSTLKMLYEEFCDLRSEGRRNYQGLHVCLDLLPLDL